MVDDFLGPDVLTVSPLSGGPFALTTIDVSEAHPLDCCYARQVFITGNVFGGGTVSRTLVLDNNWGPVLANYFETFTFDAGWGSLSSFTLNGAGAFRRELLRHRQHRRWFCRLRTGTWDADPARPGLRVSRPSPAA